MPLEVAWRLMFRVNNRAAADRCVAGTLRLAPNLVMYDPPKPYWKMPELWEVSFRSEFASPDNDGIVSTLIAAGSLGTGWLVSGPSFTDGKGDFFDGVFNVGPGRRPHAAGLQWARFTIGEFPTAGATVADPGPTSE